MLHAIRTEAIGNVKIPVLTNTDVNGVIAKDVLYTSESAANLLSVSKIVNKGFSVLFTPGDSYIINSKGSRMATMKVENGIFRYPEGGSLFCCRCAQYIIVAQALSI